MTKQNTARKGAEDAAAVLAEQAQIDAQKAAYEAQRVEAFDDIDVFGKMAAVGQTSLTDVAVRFQRAVSEGVMTAEDAGAVYMRYANAHNAALVLGGNPIKSDEAEVKSSVSQLRSFAYDGPRQLGRTLIEQVLEVRKGVATSDRAYNSAYGALVKVNREVAKLHAKLPVTVVADEDIRGWISKTGDAKEKSDLDRARELIGKLAKIADKPDLAGSALGELCKPLLTFANALAAGKAPRSADEIIRGLDAVN